MKIYISGKISGLSESEYTENFRNTESYLRFERGFKNIVNPLKIKPFLGIKSWRCYMIADIHQLLKCDAIYMMDNWHNSKGARLELAIALLFKKKICGK